MGGGLEGRIYQQLEPALGKPRSSSRFVYSGNRIGPLFPPLRGKQRSTQIPLAAHVEQVFAEPFFALCVLCGSVVKSQAANLAAEGWADARRDA